MLSSHTVCLYFIVIVSTLGFTCYWKQDKLPWEITPWLNDWYSTKRWEKRRNQINFRFTHGYIIYYLSYLLYKKNLIVIDLDRGCPITGIEFQLLVNGSFSCAIRTSITRVLVASFLMFPAVLKLVENTTDLFAQNNRQKSLVNFGICYSLSD